MLSIIIINYNSSKLIKDCLESLYKQTTQIVFEVLIVDNSMNNEDRIYILSHFQEVRWFPMGYNAGFARANNLGIKQSKGDIVLLLNPDTVILNKAVEGSYTQFENDSSCIACGVQLLNEDRTPQISGNYAMRGGLNYMLPLPYIGSFIKFLGSKLKVKKPNVADTNVTVEVDWINGAYLMVKKRAIEEAGMLDEEFFLYAEEAEWCSRLKKYGKLCIYGQYHVVHLQGETATNAFGSIDKAYHNIFDKKGLQLMLSNFVRIRKEFGKRWYFLQLGVFTLAVPLFYMIGFLHRVAILKSPFGHLSKANGLACNVFYIWKLTPKIILKRPHFYKVL